MAIQQRFPETAPLLLPEIDTNRPELPPEIFSGLGAISINHRWTSVDYDGNERQHLSLVTTGEPISHRMIYTPPAFTSTAYPRPVSNNNLTANLLGWSESTGSRIVRQTHEITTHELPEDHVLTHETPGINCEDEERCYRLANNRYTTESMAEDNTRLFNTLYKGGVVATGTSMGSIILAKMAYSNPKHGKNRINFNGLVFLAPAVLSQAECDNNMGSRFLSHMAHEVTADIAKSCLRLVTSRSPQSLIDLGDNLLHSIPGPNELRSLRAQAVSLKKGIDESIIEEVANRYHIRAISGQDDPLKAPHLQEMALSGKTKKLKYDTVPGGHDITIFPELRARLIASAVRDIRQNASHKNH